MQGGCLLDDPQFAAYLDEGLDALVQMYTLVSGGNLHTDTCLALEGKFQYPL